MLYITDQEAIDTFIVCFETKCNKAIAKVIRLNKQKKLFYQRKQKIITVELNFINELDALEEKERVEREAVRQPEPAATFFQVILVKDCTRKGVLEYSSDARYTRYQFP